jgi:hypothetical protein
LQRLISDPNCRLNWNSTQTGYLTFGGAKRVHRNIGRMSALAI